MGSIADRWQFGGVADHRFDEAQARHERLVQAVEQAGSDSDVEEDEAVTDVHAEANMTAAQRRRKWKHGSAKDDALFGPHLNYERPIPWVESFNSVKMWLKRNSQLLMRKLIAKRRLHNVRLLAGWGWRVVCVVCACVRARVCVCVCFAARAMFAHKQTKSLLHPFLRNPSSPTVPLTPPPIHNQQHTPLTQTTTSAVYKIY